MSLVSTENGGLAVGNRLQAMRANAGVFTAGQTRDITLTWPVPYPDANYTLLSDIVEQGAGTPTTGSGAKRQIVSWTSTQVTVRVSASATTGWTDGQVWVHVIGFHDG